MRCIVDNVTLYVIGYMNNHPKHFLMLQMVGDEVKTPDFGFRNRAKFLSVMDILVMEGAGEY